MAEPKIPPHNLEVEHSLLGALLIDKDAIVKVVDFLKPEHFYRDAHGTIFDAILSLYGKGEPVDLVTVTSALKKKKKLKKKKVVKKKRRKKNLKKKNGNRLTYNNKKVKRQRRKRRRKKTPKKNPHKEVGEVFNES